ncbi:hypothetical protein MAR621_01817 [Maribacter dokdonensis]|uniref:hypothetical protein n=1 Tax=Maribacter dokdonensis TaxID=320912 RepID=UPI001B0FEFE1|nr:hypothetical protein [Maribacter dokdonensis]CAG2532784.1 hypothetical protein MAR621_01817 [Maribacter dokdonensis]
MKKVTNILAVAVMAVGMATISIENTSNEFDNVIENSQSITCDDCDAPVGERPPRKTA